MALYQDIMNVPGLTGTAQQRQAQLWARLRPGEKYVPDEKNNTFLAQQIAKKNFGAPAPVQVAPQKAPVSNNPFDTLKKTALSNNILKEEIPYEQINPFSQFFNADAARKFIEQTYKSEFEREKGLINDAYNKNKVRSQEDYNTNVNTLNASDQIFKRDNALGLQKAQTVTNQNLANSGSFYGGVRTGQLKELDDNNNRIVSDYQADFNRRKQALDTQNSRYTQDLDYNKTQADFNTNREQNRTIEDQFQREKDVKTEQYLDEKKRYYGNPQYKAPGYSF